MTGQSRDVELEARCREFHQSIQRGGRPRIEDILRRVSEDRRAEWLLQLLLIEFRQGPTDIDRAAYLTRFPGDLRVIDRAIAIARGDDTDGMPTTSREGGSADAARANINTPNDGWPAKIGRYDIVGKLGCGGFGDVYKGRDPNLPRFVAIKVPRVNHSWSEVERRKFLDEARGLVDVQGPGIVTVYDVFEELLNDQSVICIVQQFIEGQTLAVWQNGQQRPIDPDKCAKMIAQIAEILIPAHRKGVIHRDLKPANIMLDREDEQPFVLDFGLALSEDQRVSRVGAVEGTLPYMSPEQTRGESHLMDGRADIWSLGVILYELLVGRRPFSGEKPGEIVFNICKSNPVPPRQYIDSIPTELQRICLKCLSKTIDDRYSTAGDLARDLLAYREAVPQGVSQNLVKDGFATSPRATVGPPVVETMPHPSEGADSYPFSRQVGESIRQARPDDAKDADDRPLRIIPRGLRSFDAEDASFFLELLPGVRERNGLPSAIDFWKRRIENPAPEMRVPVGLVFGPSGCGKSSLIKAGLLPRLDAKVTAVYLEASSETTERQLLRLLRQFFPDMPAETSLRDAMAGLQRGRWLQPEEKVLVVIDQFEQWLHARSDDGFESELRDALRQCDGQRLQAIVMVRNDYWAPSSEFFAALDLRLVERHNCQLVNLFDLTHARKVLTLFGQAYEALPREASRITPLQQEFIDAATSGLAERGKVVSVRLAVFADLVRERPWSPSTLAKFGGADGVGVAFLEEAFYSPDISPIRKRHRRAAQQVLAALLPPIGAEIKGHGRTDSELAAVAGYSGLPDDHTELLKILDEDLRLITPAFDEGENKLGYQLTHDYLVPSLREWLARKKRETPRGRAELRLEERTAAWSVKRENRQLPSLAEYVQISRLIPRRDRSEIQSRMLRRSGRVHLFRVTLLALLLILLGIAALTAREWQRIGRLAAQLISASPDQVLELTDRLDRSPLFADAHLKPLLSAANSSNENQQEVINLQLALVARHSQWAEPLRQELLSGKYLNAIPIRARFRLLPEPLFDQQLEDFRKLLLDGAADSRRRFGAALALAAHVPATDEKIWTASNLAFVARELVSANPDYQPELRRALLPIHEGLRVNLESLFSDKSATGAQRRGAANALADFDSKKVSNLASLLTVADPDQFSVLFPLVAADRTGSGLEKLRTIAAEVATTQSAMPDRITPSQRRANAAAALLRFGEHKSVLSNFFKVNDPLALSEFSTCCRPRGVGVESLLECLETAIQTLPERYDEACRYALMLALAEYDVNEVPVARRARILDLLCQWYEHDPSASVHGAASCLLRRWCQSQFVKKIDETLFAPSSDREWFTIAVDLDSKPRTWLQYVSGRAPAAPRKVFYTFVVFSHEERKAIEAGKELELRGNGQASLGRSDRSKRFAVLNREITFAELIAFNHARYDPLMKNLSASEDAVAGAVDWYDAVQFSRWLWKQSELSSANQSGSTRSAASKNSPDPSREVSGAHRTETLGFDRRGFRLPSVAEWQMARGSPMRASKAGGDDRQSPSTNGGSANSGGEQIQVPLTKRPSLSGLFDLEANAFEWTHEWSGGEAQAMTTDPQGKDDGKFKVFPGGDWLDAAAVSRAALRGWFVPPYRSVGYGFRLAISLSDVAEETHKPEPNQSR